MSHVLSTTGGMRVWAVTGPVGAGKSAVTAILRDHGAAIVDGDGLGHEVLARPAVRERIRVRFGSQYLTAAGVNRRALGEHVFGDPQALQDLNAITHPALGRLAAERLQGLAMAGKHQLAVFEAAVYFLLPSPPPVDLVVAVLAAADVRRHRLLRRHAGALSPESAAARIKAQDGMAPDWTRADETIVNEGSLDDLTRRTLQLLSRLVPGSENLS